MECGIEGNVMTGTGCRIYENELIYIEVEESEIPWLKIFTQQSAKELTECNATTQKEIFRILLLIEQSMLEFYQPEKINIASFANYLPKVHWHIMARFKNDSYWPEPVWGEKQRAAELALPSIENFTKMILSQLDE